MDNNYFLVKAIGFEDAKKVRMFGVNDIVKRVGVLSPSNVFINNHPMANPPTIFNATILVNDDNAVVYARIILGYYMYASAIVAIVIPIDDILSGSVSANHYGAQPVVYPSNRYDLWGTEDPRVYEIDGKLFMTYTGRGINYFNPAIRRERTLPITAIRKKNYTVWEKRFIHVLPKNLRQHVISDKDAFLMKISSKILLFHRPHMDNETHYLIISELPEDILDKEGLIEVEPNKSYWITHNIDPEKKIGWSCPLIKLDEDTAIVLIHGVDKELEVYRVFAIEIEYSRTEGVIIKAVTPKYIMEPKTLYEILGDRPYTIFPCGAWRISKNEILISYGAADSMVGFGLINIDELLGELDKERIH